MSLHESDQSLPGRNATSSKFLHDSHEPAEALFQETCRGPQRNSLLYACSFVNIFQPFSSNFTFFGTSAELFFFGLLSSNVISKKLEIDLIVQQNTEIVSDEG